MKTNYFNPKTLAKLGIFSALSFVFYMYLKFPLPFLFPSFLELNFSDVFALICGFTLGPVAGVITVFAKILLKLPFTHTVGVGELGDLIIGISFVLVSSVIYKRNKTMKGAVIGLISGAAASIIAAIIINIYILIPAYSTALTTDEVSGMDVILSWCRPLAPEINEQNFYSYYIPAMVLPFNILRCAVSGIITFLLYKRISALLKKF